MKNYFPRYENCVSPGTARFTAFFRSGKFFFDATRDARAVARHATRSARTLGSRARLWLVLGLEFNVFSLREAAG